MISGTKQWLSVAAIIIIGLIALLALGLLMWDDEPDNQDQRFRVYHQAAQICQKRFGTNIDEQLHEDYSVCVTEEYEQLLRKQNQGQ